MNFAPLWNDYLADPFILYHGGHYYAYGTGAGGGSHLEKNGLAFPVLTSSDLRRWEYLGGCLEPVTGDPGTAYWAPEVIFHEERFLIFYSAGGPEGEGHQIRAGESRDPAGPFKDTGRIVVPGEDFSIDPNPFCDPRDSKWYLFYAKDFFNEPVGTGAAVRPLDLVTLQAAGPEEKVVRATEAWQVFEQNRFWYGKSWERWHTIEGPAVLEHNGRYFCFYSGGNWRRENYGVGYAVSSSVKGPYTARPEKLLESRSGRLRGPGHCSILKTPFIPEPLIVFHAWDEDWKKREMRIGRLVWRGDEPGIESL